MVSVACAFFDGSAWGVTGTVTAFGLGTLRGAVYVAESVTGLPPTDCVVTAVNVPQELPLQPEPLSAQARVVLGFEPGTGISEATIVAVPLAGTLEGAHSCNEKLLVMATAAHICFEGSATLCAVSVVLAGEGRVRGAV